MEIRKLVLIILVGNIGTRKSLFARDMVLSDDSINVVNMDTIQSMISGGIYGKYKEYKKIVYHAIEKIAIESSLTNGNTVVIDRTNMDKKRRKRFIVIGKAYNCKIICYDFGIGDSNDLLSRCEDNRGLDTDTWKKVFKAMQRKYQKPSIDEGFHEIHRIDCFNENKAGKAYNDYRYGWLQQ